MQRPHLISFDTCPFVQRSVITLKEKGVDFDITYIDLANKPDWFLKISPFGKVPVLQIGDDVIFESAVINEYLEEVYEPKLHPSDPLKKAKNRAWTEFESGLNMDMFNWAMSKDEASFQENQQKMIGNLHKVESQLGDGPYFNGEKFSLVDTAYAPFFMRVNILEEKAPLNILEGMPKLQQYSAALLERQSVKDSVVSDIAKKFIGFIKSKQVYMAGLL